MARLVRPFETRVERYDPRHPVEQRNSGRGPVAIQVCGDRLTARCPSTGLYDNPPTLTARLEQRPDGLTVTGEIRESFTAAMWQPAFLGLTIFMAMLAAFGVVTLVTGYPAGGVPPLVIGLLGTVAFLALWRSAKRNRKPNFDLQVRELENGMRIAGPGGSALGSG
jgi:hypothetical protein